VALYYYVIYYVIDVDIYVSGVMISPSQTNNRAHDMSYERNITRAMKRIEKAIAAGELDNNLFSNDGYGLVSYLNCILENGYTDYDNGCRTRTGCHAQAYSYLLATLEDYQIGHYAS
jgi:hypothetical protein